MDLIKTLDKLGKKLKSGQLLEPYEVKEYKLCAAMQTLVNLRARTIEQISEIEKEDMVKTFYMMGHLFFGDEWEKIPIGDPVKEEDIEEKK
jgi:hypothetical protein